MCYSDFLSEINRQLLTIIHAYECRILILYDRKDYLTWIRSIRNW